MTPPIADAAVPEKPIVRPRFLPYLRYCFGGRLPAENDSWVLHDVTCPTWVLRHFARWMMGIVPLLTLYLAFVPISFGVRLYTGLAFSGAIFMFSIVNILIDTDRRAVRAGYSYNLPGQIRGAQSVDRQRLANHERRQRVAERKARRGR
jgi:hypothetical protein